MAVTLVRNADRMMTSASATKTGLEFAFADGCKGLVPFKDIPEIRDIKNLANIELPNPYELVLRTTKGESVEIPWDFVRRYCDPSYGSRVEAVATKGRQALGHRIRSLRESASLTQEALAAASGIGRVTLGRIESGEQSPRYGTLVALARSLGKPIQELFVNAETKRQRA
ncbi:MAG: XRE family transcriptional regulator [Dehalococcoidia bacterium]|nr:XRE family transcriptional regulator [Dehalococcoidia bacterium]